MKLIRVALPVPLNRYFDYLLPDFFSATRGARVSVSLGSQTKVGIVIDFPETSDIPVEKLKPIKAVLDLEPIFDEEIFKLLNWASSYYHAPIGEVLTSALPVKLRQGDSTERTQPDYFIVSELGHSALELGELKRAKKQQDLLNELAQLANLFEKPTACSPSAWKGLIEKGFIEKVDMPFIPQSWQEKLGNRPLVNSSNRLVLNKQQTLVVSRLSIRNGFETFFAQWSDRFWQN